MASRLTIRAVASGSSVEAEAKEIPPTACSPRRSTGRWAGLGERKSARTPKRLPIESAKLIRNGRNAR